MTDFNADVEASGTTGSEGFMNERSRETTKHDLDYDQIDELDEISGDEQLTHIWCRTHQKFEWHWIDRNRVK